jgi:hypothetical protein
MGMNARSKAGRVMRTRRVGLSGFKQTTQQKALRHSFSRKHQGFAFLAEWTGLEPATPGVTGRYSNQLNYHSAAVNDFDCLHNPSAVKLGVP